MSTDNKPCPDCNGSGRINPTGDMSTRALVDCARCDGTGVDLQHALETILKGGQLARAGETTAHALARAGDPHLVPRWSTPAERLAEIDEHQLATAFHEMSRFPAPPAPDSTTHQREAIGRAIAEYMTNARTGEDADVVSRRVVAAIGPVEAFSLADVLAKWAASLAAHAERAEKAGLRR